MTWVRWGGLRGARERPISGWLLGLLSVASGALLAASFASPAAVVAGTLGIAGWLTIVRKRRVVVAAGVGLLFGVTFQAVLLIWLAGSIGLGAWVALSLVQSLWFAALGALLSFLGNLRYPALWSAAAWTLVELLRSAWPLGGLPWGRLGYTVVDTPLAGLLPAIGVTGASFAIALGAGSVATVLIGLRARADVGLTRQLGALSPTGAPSPKAPLPVPRALCKVAAPLGVLAVALGVSGATGGEAPSTVTQDSLTVAVVQGGVPGDGRQLVAHHRQVTADHGLATETLGEAVRAGSVPAPDLVVWPENSTAVDPFRDPLARETIEGAVEGIRAPLLVGAMVAGGTPREVLNQGIVWLPSGPTGERYTKRHPVPFGEYVPWRNLLGGVSDRFKEIPRDMVAGQRAEPLLIGGVPVAVAICFDVAYDDVLPAQVQKGAQVLVVQTSNASFFGTEQLEQQFTITRARALESRRAVAVASTNGITALIGPDGSVLERAPLGGKQVLVAALPLRDDVTPAVRWGQWVSPGVFTLVLLGVGLVCSERVRAHGSERVREPSTGPRPRR